MCAWGTASSTPDSVGVRFIGPAGPAGPGAGGRGESRPYGANGACSRLGVGVRFIGPAGPAGPGAGGRDESRPNALLLLLVIVLAFTAPCCAFAAPIAGDLEVSCATGGMQWKPAETVQLSFPSVTTVDAFCTPDLIYVGVSCGMDEMCGLDPCLCGAADEFGCCACNGLEERKPDIAINTSNALCALPLCIGGRWFVASMLPGEADLDVSGTLIHYNDFSAAYHVESSAVSIAGLVVLVVALVIIIAVARMLVRVVRRARNGSDGGA